MHRTPQRPHPAIWIIFLTGLGCAVASIITSQVVTGQPGQQPPPAQGRQPAPGQVTTRTPMTTVERLARFQAGDPWRGQGKTGLTQQQVDTFPDYRLFWLGESFAGYNLQGIVRAKYEPPSAIPPQYAHGEDVVSFVYGTCKPDPGFSRCVVPAQVQVRPICVVRPDHILPTAKVGAPQATRSSAQLQRLPEGSVILWTGRVSVQVTVSADPTLVDQAVAQLRTVGAGQASLPTIGAGQALPPPDFTGCPSVTMPPFPPPRASTP
jgi:hypothetical protein